MKTFTFLIGYAAVAVGTTFMLPQVVKSWKTKRVDDLSLASVTLYFANSILWLTYGLLIAAWPVAIANALALVISILQVFLKLKYRLQPTPIVQIEHAAAWVSDLERARAFYELSSKSCNFLVASASFSLEATNSSARACSQFTGTPSPRR